MAAARTGSDKPQSDAGPQDLNGLLDEVAQAADDSGGDVCFGDILDRIGTRSFGPVLMVPAIICLTPLGGLPLLPTVMAGVVILIAGQMVFGLDHFWLPKILLERGADKDKVKKSVKAARPVARVVDHLIRPRLTRLTREPFVHLAAAVCILVALTVPPLELVPFAAAISWGAIGIFGLALVAHDGLLALIAFGFSLGAAWLVFSTLI